MYYKDKNVMYKSAFYKLRFFEFMSELEFESRDKENQEGAKMFFKILESFILMGEYKV